MGLLESYMRKKVNLDTHHTIDNKIIWGRIKCKNLNQDFNSHTCRISSPQRSISVSHPRVVFVFFRPSTLWMVLWMLQIKPTQSGQLLECPCARVLRCPRAEVQGTALGELPRQFMVFPSCLRAVSPRTGLHVLRCVSIEGNCLVNGNFCGGWGDFFLPITKPTRSHCRTL